jgi:hypothetical protein
MPTPPTNQPPPPQVTIAKYLTPKGRDVGGGRGLDPAVACDDFPRGLPSGGGTDACVRIGLAAIMADVK